MPKKPDQIIKVRRTSDGLFRYSYGPRIGYNKIGRAWNSLPPLRAHLKAKPLNADEEVVEYELALKRVVPKTEL